MTFRETAGPRSVGSVVCPLVDTSRPANLGSHSMGRELIVKVWYPSRAASNEPEPSGRSCEGMLGFLGATCSLAEAVKYRTSLRRRSPPDGQPHISTLVDYPSADSLLPRRVDDR